MAKYQFRTLQNQRNQYPGHRLEQYEQSSQQLTKIAEELLAVAKVG